MKSWFKKFVAVNNEVNEDTVLGCIFAVAMLVCVFVPMYNSGIIPTSIAMGAFFGKNSFKK